VLVRCSHRPSSAGLTSGHGNGRGGDLPLAGLNRQGHRDHQHHHQRLKRPKALAYSNSPAARLPPSDNANQTLPK